MNVLLAAEADRIQGYLFRSARLREVVGGSQLLRRFCKKVPSLLGVPKEDVITNGGGSFYIKFADEKEALKFGASLAEVYYRITGSTLSVAAPVPYDGRNYYIASKKAGKSLRRAKQSLGGPLAMAHFPHVALCSSCGVGLAERHQERYAGDPAPDYLCAACRRKAEERWHGKEEGEKGVREPAESFLQEFYSLVRPDDWDEYNWPGRRGPGRWQATAAEDIAPFDPRGYVAYIVADGNGMGEIFNKCKKEAFVKGLSDALTPVLRKSLSIPIRNLFERWKQESEKKREEGPKLIPALPLILGGDDLFALVPAPWALDIARRFCQEFQSRINERAKALVDETGEPFTDTITMTATVVICKQTYPYYLAHQVGEERLGAAKRVVKTLALQEAKSLSAVDFEFIVSSQLPRPERKQGKGSRKEPDRRATLRPYWVIPIPDPPAKPDEPVKPPEMPDPSKWGTTVEDLLMWRLDLSQLPSRQRSRLRDLYDPLSVPRPRSSEEEEWESQREDLLMRATRDYEGEDKPPILQAIETLVGQSLSEWPVMQRTDSHPDEDWYGHPLPDLLRVWDFALKLDKKATDYEGGER